MLNIPQLPNRSFYRYLTPFRNKSAYGYKIDECLIFLNFRYLTPSWNTCIRIYDRRMLNILQLPNRGFYHYLTPFRNKSAYGYNIDECLIFLSLRIVTFTTS